MRTLTAAVQKPNPLVVGIIFLISIALLLWVKPEPPSPDSQAPAPGAGYVIQIISEREIAADEVALVGAAVEQTVLVRVDPPGSDEPTRQITAKNLLSPLAVGDRVFVQSSAEQGDSFVVVERSRTRGIAWLVGLFVAFVLAVSGRKGLYALVGLVFSMAGIATVLVPQILAGRDAILAAILTSVLIVVVSLYVTHGFHPQSLSALLGIFGTLIFVGVLAQVAVRALHLTGFASEEAAFLGHEASGVRFVPLVIAGIIIAAIGVLDDVAVTQASTVFSLRAANLTLSRWELFRRAMVVGRDHISAVINTLVFAYVGAALPLVVLFFLRGAAPGYAMSIELTAEEIVRTLISTSGLVLAVPATTAVAVFFGKYKTG